MGQFKLPEDFPDRVYELRLSRGLSVAELGDLAGLTGKTVRNAERKPQVNRPTDRTVMMLAAALKVPLADLIQPRDPEELDGAAVKPRSLSVRRTTVPAVTVLVTISIVFAVLFGYGRTHADWSYETHELTAWDSVFGIKLWSAYCNAAWSGGYESPWDSRQILVGTGSEAPDGGRLLCLEKASGDTLWSVGPDIAAVTRAFGEKTVGAAGFSCNKVKPVDIDGDGTLELAVIFCHGLYYPTAVCLIDQTGDLVAQYAHRGHLLGYVAEDLDADGKDEVLVWGTNNASAYEGFTVFELSENHWAGASVDSLSSPSTTEFDGSAARLVVPDFPAPYMDLLGRPRLEVFHLHIFRTTQNSLRYNVRVGGDFPSYIEVTLDPELRPLSAQPTDSFMVMMKAEWPDSLTVGTGPGNQAWLDSWLGSSVRFGAGLSPAER